MAKYKYGLHMRFGQSKNKAKRRGLVWSLTPEEFETIVIMNCHYCGAKPQRTYKMGNSEGKPQSIPIHGIDRVNSKAGYSRANVVPCCIECNMAKGSMGFKDFIKHIQRIYLRFFNKL